MLNHHLILQVNLFEVLEHLRELCEDVIRWTEENNDEPVTTETANAIVGCLEQVFFLIF